MRKNSPLDPVSFLVSPQERYNSILDRGGNWMDKRCSHRQIGLAQCAKGNIFCDFRKIRVVGCVLSLAQEIRGWRSWVELVLRPCGSAEKNF